MRPPHRRLKGALERVYGAAAQSQSLEAAPTVLERSIEWAKRSRLQPFKRLARTLQAHFEGVMAFVHFGHSV